MKLEKFRVGRKKKIMIIISIIAIFTLINGIVLFKTYSLYEENKAFNVLNGTVPMFGNTTGTVELAYTIDGQVKTAPFPTKESKYIAKNVTCDNGVEASWNNMEWALVVKNSNNKEKVKCTIDFTKKKIEVYGIERSLASTSSAWTRTNDAVGKVANAQKNSTVVQNDFDNIYPWSNISSYNYNTSTKKITAWYGQSGFSFDGTNGEVLTYIPEFYYQRYQDGTKEYIEISKEYIEGFTKSEAFSVGRYLKLETGTISDYRTSARNIGSGFGLLDYHWFLIQMLYLVEYADYNSQAKLGLGNTNNTVPLTKGGCDTLGMKSGTLNNDGKHSMIYRGLEDIYGNLYQVLDGINIRNRKAYICYDQTKYASDTFTGCYKEIGYTNASENGYIIKLGYDKNNPLISFPIESGGTDSTYIPDNYVQSLGDTIVLTSHSWKGSSNSGFWYYNLTSPSSVEGGYNAGYRLLKIN